MITNASSGTNLNEVAPSVFRINTPIEIPGGPGFNFNQYLIVDDEPLLFHTGPRQLFPLVAEAIARLLPLDRLRHIAFSHFEADECGSLNDFLSAAPAAVAACSQVGAMVSVNDIAIRPPRAMADGEILCTGARTFKWLDAPHVPHGWDCGFMIELETRTLLCGDLFTQGGPGTVALTGDDILGPSEAFRQAMDYYAHAPHTAATLERLANEQPRVLACMHGSAWHGDAAALLRGLARSIAGRPARPDARD